MHFGGTFLLPIILAYHHSIPFCILMPFSPPILGVPGTPIPAPVPSFDLFISGREVLPDGGLPGLPAPTISHFRRLLTSPPGTWVPAVILGILGAYLPFS